MRGALGPGHSTSASPSICGIASVGTSGGAGGSVGGATGGGYSSVFVVIASCSGV